MRIKRLDITGFKSFMDRTVFTFDDGVTGVVGPNGCGKSNVVDAMRWCMGEQSAKNLRGRGMEDVIFNGSEAHAPLSMAEVTLTFSVDEGDVMPETLAGLPEVSVTRRLFRSGESEYQINKTTCRLLDVTELFLGTGVGTRAYSIIEQGRVGQIVSARPEDRRTFIEEAAGVTRYKARRRAAERKLEHTQHNLLRVKDIVSELGKRLDSLERQARKAEKYKRLKSEMRDIELRASSHRWLELTAQKKVLDAELASRSSDERDTFDAVKRLEDDIGGRRAALEAEAAALEQVAAEVHALERQVELDAQSAAHRQADLDATRLRLEEARGELAGVEQRRALLEAERAAALAELERLGVASKEDEVALGVREEELRRASTLAGEVVARLEGERRELLEVAARAANQESRLEALEQRRLELEQRQARLGGELEVLRAEEQQLESLRAEVLERVEQHRAVTAELTQRRGEEESSLARLREAFAESEVLVISLREALADKRSRLASLEEIQRNYEGFDRGVRAVMLKVGAEGRQQGVFGLVADVVTAPPRFEKAVEAALGERLQHVIVETPERGFELVAYLRELAEGRSTFLPVPLAPVEPLPALSSPGVLAMALDEVTVGDEAVRPVVAQLLSGVALVDDLEAARGLAAQHPAHTFVTLEGEVLRPGGGVTGGLLEGPAVGALQKKREISELQAEVSEVEARYNELITRHYELQKQVGHTEGVLKGLEKNKHQEELSLAGHEKDLHQAGSSLVRLRERTRGLETEQRSMADSAASLAVEAEAARGELVQVRTDRELREERARQLDGERASLEARQELLGAELTGLKVKVASVSERGDGVRQRADALGADLAGLDERAERLARAIEETLGRQASLEQQLGEGQAERAEEAEQLGARKAAVEARRAAHAQAQATVRDDEANLKQLREKAEGLSQGLSGLALRDRELVLELEHLIASVAERHQVSLVEAVHEYHQQPMLSEDAQGRLKELRAQVERMGEVNVTAIDEHREIAERHGFLSRQQGDLEGSLAQLKEAITRIDETSRARFKETFDIVNQKFQEVFPRLFGGGRASLTLVQGAPGEEPGVEILAQPPGKKLQTVGLFSGGEKALTAVAMIFGIFLIKPTPFCLLDEVDAPLDEGNVGRYNELVKEMSKTSQFILITHNKRTMEVADTLYGVTMEEPGVSKLVTVKLHQAAANGDQQVA